MVANSGKCYLLTSTSEEVSVKMENEIIKNSSQKKLLGIVIDNRLSTFEPHMKNLCKKSATETPCSCNNQYDLTPRIYVLHKITIALKFMSYINQKLRPSYQTALNLCLT